MPSRKLIVEIAGDTRSLDRAFKNAQTSSSRFGRTFGGVAKAAGVAALGIGAGVAFGLKKSIDSANEHAEALAQTQAVLKSTGQAAHVTAGQITGFADAMEKKTGVDDLAIQRGENLLATFTNVRNEVGKGNDIFTQASKAVLDMSVALGQDTKTSAIQLGKALNDPIKGVSALQRVGVSFTADQKAQIKQLVATGHAMDAQKMILAELNKEFGGSAEAAGKTLPGQLNILKARLDDVAQKIGEKLVPALTNIINWVTKHWPQISKVIETTFAAIQQAWNQAGKPAFTAVVDVVRQVIVFFRRNWPEISETIRNSVKVIKAVFNAVWPTVSKVVRTAVDTIVPLVRSIFQTIKGVVQLIRGILHGDWSEVWNGLKNIVGGVIHGVTTLLKAAVKNWATIGTALGRALGRAILTALRGFGKLLAAVIKAPVNAVIAAVNALKIPAFKIHIAVPLAPDIDFKTPSIDPIPNIPRLAAGGLVTRPTVALLGERGPEAVVPLGRGGGTLTIRVPVILDGRQIAEAVAVHQARAGRRNVELRRGRSYPGITPAF